MRRTSTVALTALIMLATASCSASTIPESASETSASTPESSPTPTPTPTVEPGPVELSQAEAASRYLQIVCPTNAARKALGESFAAWDDVFIADGVGPGADEMKSVAGPALAATYNSVVLFDDPYFVWPAAVEAHIPVIRDAYLADVSPLDAINNATSFEQAYNVMFPDAAAASVSAQEARLALAIPPDTTSSCVGHEAGQDFLLSEKSEREAALAAQSAG